MIMTVIINLIGVLVLVPVALLVAKYALGKMDDMNGTPFSEILRRMLQKPEALALYYGMRFIAVGIIIAALFGKWV